MDNRTRIVNTILGREIDRAPYFMYLGLWTETERRWRREGLGTDMSWEEPFGLDRGIVGICDFSTPKGVRLGYTPWFEAGVIEDKGETIITRDIFGVVKEDRKDGLSFPRFLAHPVRTREDWEELKATRLNPNDPARFPPDWDKVAAAHNAGDGFIQMGDYPYGLFGTCRDMMGVEELLVSFHTQPDLIHDMMDTLTDLWLGIYDRICQTVRVDCVHMWEDMSGRSGSLISPAMVRAFMLPNYRRIKAFCSDHHIPVFSVDTDGDVRELVPLFMEAGVNFMWPFEVAAGCDVLAYQRQYPTLGIMGGIDKREIAKGRAETDRELERVLAMLRNGRYIPALDHAAHPEISWADFSYYMLRLKDIIGVR
ncbi:MAG: uroporphyrinogen decarboxylase family protein [Anaerolineae bacterium]